jgi:Leucine-rich repeat (LRR) protein
MEALNFFVNRFSGAIPPSFSNLSALTKLSLQGNDFTGYVPSALGRLQSLTVLLLSDNRLEANDNQGWEFITSLANSSQLQLLVLSNNSFCGNCQIQLQTCHQFSKVFIWETI